MGETAAVILDLDGVLIDSEARWDEVRETFTREAGGAWRDDAQRAMMGMSSSEWSAYMRDELGVPLEPEEISREVVRRMEEGYRASVPWLPGAIGAVHALAGSWPLALASSANRPLIELVLELGDLREAFRATVSSEEVEAGKPAPDVYLEAARRLRVEPGRAVAVEDSSNGLRSAAAAGMRVIAVPDEQFPPAPDALALAAACVPSITDVTPALIERL